MSKAKKAPDVGAISRVDPSVHDAGRVRDAGAVTALLTAAK